MGRIETQHIDIGLLCRRVVALRRESQRAAQCIAGAFRGRGDWLRRWVEALAKVQHRNLCPGG